MCRKLRRNNLTKFKKGSIATRMHQSKPGLTWIEWSMKITRDNTRILSLDTIASTGLRWTRSSSSPATKLRKKANSVEFRIDISENSTKIVKINQSLLQLPNYLNKPRKLKRMKRKKNLKSSLRHLRSKLIRLFRPKRFLRMSLFKEWFMKKRRKFMIEW